MCWSFLSPRHPGRGSISNKGGGDGVKISQLQLILLPRICPSTYNRLQLQDTHNVGHNKQFVGHFENTRDGTSADSLEIYGKISVSVLGRSSLAAASIVDAAQANERLFFSGNPTGKPPYICIFLRFLKKNIQVGKMFNVTWWQNKASLRQHFTLSGRCSGQRGQVLGFAKGNKSGQEVRKL